MSDKKINFLIPNSFKGLKENKKNTNRSASKNSQNEFDQILNRSSLNKKGGLHSGIDVSGHAAKRIHERKIDFNGDEYMKVKNAINKLREKGANQSLVVTDSAAYIVDVAHNKLVTAVDKKSINDNVFTKIDSTMIVN